MFLMVIAAKTRQHQLLAKRSILGPRNPIICTVLDDDDSETGAVVGRGALANATASTRSCPHRVPGTSPSTTTLIQTGTCSSACPVFSPSRTIVFDNTRYDYVILARYRSKLIDFR